MFGDHFQITDVCKLSQATAKPKDPKIGKGERKETEKADCMNETFAQGEVCVLFHVVWNCHTLIVRCHLIKRL